MGKEMKINWKRLNGVMITGDAGGGRVRRIIFSELINWLQVNLSKILNFLPFSIEYGRLPFLWSIAII